MIIYYNVVADLCKKNNIAFKKCLRSSGRLFDLHQVKVFRKETIY